MYTSDIYIIRPPCKWCPNGHYVCAVWEILYHIGLAFPSPFEEAFSNTSVVNVALPETTN